MSEIEKTLKERGSRYGDFKSHAEITQRLKLITYLHADTCDISLSATQKEALDMIFHKIGRIVNGDPDYADSWHDIAGYATLAEKELLGKAEYV